MKKIISYTIIVLVMFSFYLYSEVSNSESVGEHVELMRHKLIEEVTLVPNFLIDSSYIKNHTVSSIDSVSSVRRSF